MRALLFSLVFAAGTAWAAPQVALSGIMGSKALLVVNGAMRSLGEGESHQGVRLLRVERDSVLIEADGVRSSLRLGAAPVSIGERPPSASGGRIVLHADSRGHFYSQVRIQGQLLDAVIDTGATTIAMSQQDAERIGLSYREGRPVRMQTANGIAQGWRVKLDTVRLGDVQLYGLDAVVSPQPMPVLLGNNFLAEFRMTRHNDQMVLDKRP